MMKLRHKIDVTFVATFLFLMCCSVTFAASNNFSADVLITNGKEITKGKIYVSENKARSEFEGMATISRMDKNVVWMLIADEKMYMEQKLNASQVVPRSEAAENEVERVLLGKEYVDKKECNKYRISVVVAGQKSTHLLWLAVDTGFPLKMAAEDGTWAQEYRNLVIGDQPNHLFEIPAGYQKLNMPGM